MKVVLVTGASGFIGAPLALALAKQGRVVRASYRTSPSNTPLDVETIVIGGDGADTDWGTALRGVGAVVHLAGPAHAKHSDDYLRREIAGQTARLAAQAEQAGVQRFIFVSSIKAAAAKSARPLRETDPPAPEDAYGRAKLEAETAVMARAELCPVVLRPPLVCAPDAKANFASLLRLADTAWPLPFASLTARRSIIARDSLIRAVALVLSKPDGPAGVFHIADQPPLSVAEMIAALRAGMGRPLNQFALPGLGAVLPAVLRQSLTIDDSAYRAAYGSYVEGDARDMLKAIGSAWASQ